ncbi:hypothetical protein Clacol_004637 [Clathrus columnatus]|uniref:Uncharacterized protein n=1 Tax=Clathrus columnatus TaxID=1419009 RepID=A0AAV5A707_9AGAM|nr:hypothetical protein Clacol_004637 [Clathrus columnatus]
MLDSSPIRGPVRGTTAQPPPPPSKKKRNAAEAFLSPPPTGRPKKVNRPTLTARRGSYIGDSDVEEGDGEDEDDDGEFVGRKILFPTSPSARAGAQAEQTVEDDEFFAPTASPAVPVDTPTHRSVSPVRRSARLQAAATISSAPSTPVKPKLKRSLSLSVSPTRVSNRLKRQREEDRENKGKCKAHELPVLDEDEDNPFLVKTPSPKSKQLKGKGKVTGTKTVQKDDDKVDGQIGRSEPRHVTYVFKGVKTHFPNPYYNLSPSAYKKAQLPLEHPDYEPLPPQPSQLKFKPSKKRSGMNGASGSRSNNGESSSKQYTDSEDEEYDDEEGEPVGEDAIANIDADNAEPSSPTQEEASLTFEPRTPDNKPKYSGFRSESGKPLLDSGPEGVRGAVMDSNEVGRMALGPIRDKGRSEGSKV